MITFSLKMFLSTIDRNQLTNLPQKPVKRFLLQSELLLKGKNLTDLTFVIQKR